MFSLKRHKQHIPQAEKCNALFLKFPCSQTNIFQAEPLPRQTSTSCLTLCNEAISLVILYFSHDKSPLATANHAEMKLERRNITKNVTAGSFILRH